MSDLPELLPTVAVHCFLQCGHIVRDFDARAAHDRMEEHYATEHYQRVFSLVGKLPS